MENYDEEYIRRILKELNWDLDRKKIIRFKSRKGLNMVRNGRRIEIIFIIREIE